MIDKTLTKMCDQNCREDRQDSFRKQKSVHLITGERFDLFLKNQIKGRYGGLISKPDAVAVAPGIMNIVVGTGNTRESGGPSGMGVQQQLHVLLCRTQASGEDD